MSFWRLRLAALLLAALPAFTGWRPPGWSQVLIPGASLGTVLVALGANAVIGLACGPGVLGGALTVAAMMVLAVVFSGATVSCGLYWLGWAYPGGPSDFSPHYLALALNMLTVIPLAVAMVMTLPLERAETALLRSGRPVSPVRKGALMALRVFNHVTFFVIPEILEIVREERMLAPQGLGAWRRDLRVPPVSAHVGQGNRPAAGRPVSPADTPRRTQASPLGAGCSSRARSGNGPKEQTPCPIPTSTCCRSV
jgi:hypothetical protein